MVVLQQVLLKMLRRLARITKPFQDLYTLEDDVYKVYNYHIEKAR